MKMSPEEKKAWENMKPGVITSQGFLGDQDDHPLNDMIESDREAMASITLDINQVAEKLYYLLEEGRKGLGEPITIDNTWIVRADETRGFLACPFEDGIYNKTNLEIENRKTGKKILCSELSIHLLKDHHFLQGKGSPFRLSPFSLKEVLEL